MRTKRLKWTLGVLLGLVVLLWANKAWRDAHYFDNYDPHAPLNVAVLETTVVRGENPELGYTLIKFTFAGYRGEKVPTLMSLPLKRTEPKLPVIIFLHGIGQNKNFLKEITTPFNQAGFAFVCFDQYTQGERKLAGHVPRRTRLAASVQRPAKTVNETRRLIDYLSTHPDLDERRLYLVGASFGAITGTTVLARDKRLRAGVLVYGGGDLRHLARSDVNRLRVAAALGLIDGKNLDPEKPPLPQLTRSQEWIVGLVIGGFTPLVRYFLGAADPIHYAGQISPTPVYFQNGKYDRAVPAPAARALQDAAREPKKITWYESDHVGIDRAHTLRVLADGLHWLLEQDEPFRAPEEKIASRPPFALNRP